MAKPEEHNKEDNCFWYPDDSKLIHPRVKRGYCKDCPRCLGCAKEMEDEQS